MFPCSPFLYVTLYLLRWEMGQGDGTANCRWLMDARQNQVDTKRQIVMDGFVIFNDNYTHNIPTVVRSAQG